MILYDIVSVICLLILLANVVQTVYQLCTYEREERITFVRNYKKGKFVIVYLVALPLYFLANYYASKALISSVTSALSNAVSLVALSLDPTGNAAALAAVNAPYQWALYVCYGTAYLNFGMFVLSIFFEYLVSYWHMLKFHLSNKTKCVILGNNAGSVVLYKTCDEKQKMLVDLLTKEEKTALYMKGVQSQSFVRWELVYSWIIKEGKRLARVHARKHEGLFSAKNKLVVIVNTDNEDLNLKMCDELVARLNDCSKQVAGCVQVHVYGNGEHADVYGEYEKKAKGCMEHVDKYTLSAIELIDQYPMTKYLDERHVDYQTSLIKEGVDLNVIFVGFGKRNRQAFLTMVANNQFLTQTPTGIDVKQVRYHFFDKAETDNHKNLNHTYYRYRHHFVEKVDEIDMNAYLPLPKLPAQECYHCLDIHSIRFYDEIKSIVTANANAVTQIVVSFGSDLDNADLAHKLLMKINEWGVSDAHVFVKIKDEKLSETIGHLLAFDNCHLFGNKNKCDYNYGYVVNEKFQNMALQRNYLYDVESALSQEGVTALDEQALRALRMQSRVSWYVDLSHIERESNVFACLGLRHKLHLMGLDYCDETAAGEALDYEQYIHIYAGADMPRLGTYHAETKKSVVLYDTDFANSRRSTMAMQEHYRWNAYMITKGFIPATKEEIITAKKSNGKFSNGKSYLLRRHGNLTTMDGLIEFRKIVAHRDHATEVQKDVIKYDYQILDDAYWLLKRNGYKMIKK